MYIGATSLRPIANARDQRTLELRNFFRIPPPGTQSTYSIDRWFFFPRNLAVSEESYGSDAFYRHSQVLLRLQPLDLRLSLLADLTDRANPGRMLLDQARELLDPVPTRGPAMSTIAQLFGAEIVDAVHDAVEHVRTLAKRGTRNLESSVQRLCTDIFAALEALRSVRRSLLPYGRIAHPELLPTLEFGEEYACAVVDERLSELALEIGGYAKLRDGTGTVVRCQLVLAEAMTRLNRRRRDEGFIAPGRHAGEHYSYRVGLLKKMLQRSLYVDTRQTRTDPLVANSAAMVAAGLAATWATIAQVPLFQANLSSTQGGLIFAGAVGAYMVKDRIKDLVRNRLLKRWRPWDHDQRIVTSLFNHLDLSNFGGRSRERVRWQSERSVERAVLEVRQAHRTVHGASTEFEQVLHYSRQLEIAGLEGPAEQSGSWGIQSIFRFSLSEIMAHLDDPVDEITYFDDDTGFCAGTIPKVYHVNVVHRTRDEGTGEEYLARLRIVLNRKQILRVEHVETDLD